MVSKRFAKEQLDSSQDESMAARISASRLLYQNPYAYQDGDGAFSAAPTVDPAITESRKKLQNQYAHLNGQGGFSALRKSTPLHDKAFPTLRPNATRHAKKRPRHSNADIERIAKDLQKKMWQERGKIWAGRSISDPIEILDPATALHTLGFDYDLVETLGQYAINGKQIEVAGLIDDSEKFVRISGQFAGDIRKFTAAHELGHALLHDARGLHRDRPLNGVTFARDPIEFEADKFASYFLMPEKLLRARFEMLFATDHFLLNEDTAFALGSNNMVAWEKGRQTLRDLSRMLASTQNYNGARFLSLASQFGVSSEAMAIRLEEIGMLEV